MSELPKIVRARLKAEASGDHPDPNLLAAFAEQLPDGVYRLGEVPDFCGGANAALAWRLGLYAFDRYKKPKARHQQKTSGNGDK